MRPWKKRSVNINASAHASVWCVVIGCVFASMLVALPALAIVPMRERTKAEIEKATDAVVMGKITRIKTRNFKRQGVRWQSIWLSVLSTKAKAKAHQKLLAKGTLLRFSRRCRYRRPEPVKRPAPARRVPTGKKPKVPLLPRPTLSSIRLPNAGLVWCNRPWPRDSIALSGKVGSEISLRLAVNKSMGVIRLRTVPHAIPWGRPLSASIVKPVPAKK